MSNNKRRLLALIKVLTKESNKNKPINESDLKAILSKDDIEIRNRKTIYEDIEVLNEYGYEVIYDTKKKGYYLNASPFTLSELKILIDGINDLKDFDSKTLKEKLLSFVSYDEEKLLDSNVVNKKIKTSKISYLKKIEIILDAIKKNEYLIVEYNNKQNTIEPYYLHFSNLKYYLYFRFENNKQIYSYRLDRIKDIKNTNNTFEDDGSALEAIKKRIKISYDNFNKNKAELIKLKAINYEKISNRLEDDFPEHYLDNSGNIIIEYDPNEIFYSKLVSYGNSLKVIEPKTVKNNYLKYLKQIINNYK